VCQCGRFDVSAQHGPDYPISAQPTDERPFPFGSESYQIVIDRDFGGQISRMDSLGRHSPFSQQQSLVPTASNVRHGSNAVDPFNRSKSLCRILGPGMRFDHIGDAIDQLHSVGKRALFILRRLRMFVRMETIEQKFLHAVQPQHGCERLDGVAQFATQFPDFLSFAPSSCRSSSRIQLLHPGLKLIENSGMPVLQRLGFVPGGGLRLPSIQASKRVIAAFA
jgi:hypothetical protein